ncbi:restriction endonuclease [Paenibacillus sp. LHD-38]|uniref:restriction endonuclease n=1 Tax=Paenibacillus sp. LHD-38 TaxID=3072143 RepID=UPI00280EDE7C|nr:restriction endonuclease [Paenibacillus sp. LHD-38]MDQ8734255.1 restriction endonuclease [Paenibacillus sp. LHD-38]
MAIYSKKKILQLLKESDEAPNSDIKGDKLEELVRYLFEKVPNVSFFAKNIIDSNRAQEIDVVFWNLPFSAIHFLDTVLITECKNTAEPIGSNDVGWFVRKLQDKAAQTGIIISLNGITGSANGERNAHSEIRSAIVRDRIAILLITRDEILQLNNTNDLAAILKNKYLKLKLQQTVV